MSFADYIAGVRERKIRPTVVYCKECRHYYSYSENWGVCEYTRQHQEKALDVKPDHFCGWGEKKC